MKIPVFRGRKQAAPSRVQSVHEERRQKPLAVSDCIIETLAAHGHVPLRRREIHDLIVQKFGHVSYRIFADVLNQLVRVDRTVRCFRPKSGTKRDRRRRSRFDLVPA